MAKGPTRSDYDARLARVRDHIYDHLDEDLDFARLAEIACLSPHHWHRIYHAVHGETAFATVKRLRLHRAAADLAYSSMPLDQVARRAGYESAAAFTRAFQPAYGMPPARYRREGGHTGFAFPPAGMTGAMHDITVRETSAIPLAGLDHTGSYMEIERAFGRLHQLFAKHSLYRPGQKMIAVYFDDPLVTPTAQLRSFAALSAPDDVALPPPLRTMVLPGGPCAVLRHVGPYAEMKASYDWLFGAWLPQSGREAADALAYEVYINTPMDAAPKDLITDIYLPLKP